MLSFPSNRENLLFQSRDSRFCMPIFPRQTRHRAPTLIQRRLLLRAIKHHPCPFLRCLLRHNTLSRRIPCTPWMEYLPCPMVDRYNTIMSCVICVYSTHIDYFTNTRVCSSYCFTT
jgi:hypothetical protein